jgi:hypothetical protein
LFIATKIPAHLVPFSKGQMGSQSPLGASSKKLCNFKANSSHPVFLQATVASPMLGIDFFEKIQGHCCPRDQPITVCSHCSGLARPEFAFSGPVRLAIFV